MRNASNPRVLREPGIGTGFPSLITAKLPIRRISMLPFAAIPAFEVREDLHV